ncbi:MAG TPA: DJ-1/PfpI family protein, partial [Gaiellaceae bacterium]|nr:DJ-1/PfpI family protein [Gaiellaceae bacterium]
MADLNGKRVAILATDMVEQVELVEPRKAVEEAGADVELVSLETGEIQGFNHYDKADAFPVDKAVGDVSADDYDALLLPGG